MSLIHLHSLLAQIVLLGIRVEEDVCNNGALVVGVVITRSLCIDDGLKVVLEFLQLERVFI